MTPHQLLSQRLPPNKAHGQDILRACRKQRRKQNYDCCIEALIDCEWFKYKVVMGRDPELALCYRYDHTLIGPPNIPAAFKHPSQRTYFQRIQLTRIGLLSHILSLIYLYITGHPSMMLIALYGPTIRVNLLSFPLYWRGFWRCPWARMYAIRRFHGSWLSLSFDTTVSIR